MPGCPSLDASERMRTSLRSSSMSLLNLTTTTTTTTIGGVGGAADLASETQSEAADDIVAEAESIAMSTTKTMAITKRPGALYRGSTSLVIRDRDSINRLVEFVCSLPHGPSASLRAPMPFTHATLYVAVASPCRKVLMSATMAAATAVNAAASHHVDSSSSPTAPQRELNDSMNAIHRRSPRRRSLLSTTMSTVPGSPISSTRRAKLSESYRIEINGVMCADSVRNLLQHVAQHVPQFAAAMICDSTTGGFNYPRTDATLLSPKRPTTTTTTNNNIDIEQTGMTTRLCDAVITRVQYNSNVAVDRALPWQFGILPATNLLANDR